ncbi:hypothetical protein [Nocardia sp. alder85J]|uniref:hypothetical protein n=1 Tax=Nocardia sp. alder85J TaxID=2862949 RepID=UPI001CD7C835|nr:hypothetical protein [Nocardia sp. alder85J]MCX4095852.1 hypothetical protein [Nocardia sp. alder85J]
MLIGVAGCQQPAPIPAAARGRLPLALTISDPDRIRWTTVPFEALREEILDSRARARILILDRCFAGRAFEAMSDLSSPVAGQTDVRGTYTIASSSSRNETSFALPCSIWAICWSSAVSGRRWSAGIAAVAEAGNSRGMARLGILPKKTRCRRR